MWPRAACIHTLPGALLPHGRAHSLGPGVGCEQGGSAGSATLSLGACPPGEYSLILLVSTAFENLTQQVPVSVRAALPPVAVGVSSQVLVAGQPVAPPTARVETSFFSGSWLSMP